MPDVFAQQSRQRRQEAMLLDALLMVLAFVIAYRIRTSIGELRLLAHLALLPVILPLWMFLLVFFRAYRSPSEASAVEILMAPVRAVGAGLALLFALVFLLRAHDVSRATLISFGVFAAVTLVGARVVQLIRARRSLRRGETHRRVLIIGSGNRAKRLVRGLRQNPYGGIEIVGFLDPDPTMVGKTILGAPILGTLDEISTVLKDQVVDEVVLAIPRSLIGVVEKVARACEEEGVRIRLMADLFEINVVRMTLDEFEDMPLLTFEPVAQEEWELLLKRVMDVTLTLAVMPIVLPLMAAIAIAIKLDSRGSVFFRQWRVGQSKRQFRMFKFRTMAEGSERLQTQLEHMNEAQGPVFKITNDPRITRVGRLLRRTSLDELPQFFNVLRGEMSLVGPRPLPLRDVNLFDRGIQRKRFSVKPGVTGLWQVSGRSDLDFSEWLRLDLRYIEQWSLGLDVRILAHTVPAVLRAHGAR